MKKTAIFAGLLFLLSGISGYLLSKASFTGRMGISLFYRQYRFLKTWWQGALAVFLAWLILLLLQGLAQQKLPERKAKTLHMIMIAFAATGLFLTYYDFGHTATHRMLGSKFHAGAYLFWIGSLLISLFYLFQKKPGTLEP